LKHEEDFGVEILDGVLNALGSGSRFFLALEVPEKD
jgi:hypothetical protein